MDLGALWEGVVAFLYSSKYVLMYFGTMTEGPLFMLGGGLLYHLGQVPFWPTYLTLVFGDFTGDIIWYSIGYFGARPAILRWGKYLQITPLIVDLVERQFHRFDTRILIISKLTMGFGFALTVLMVAGMLRVSFVRYLTINLLCGFVWTFFLFTVGYFFGNVLTTVPTPIGIILGLGGPVLTLLLLRVAGNYLSSRVQQEGEKPQS